MLPHHLFGLDAFIIYPQGRKKFINSVISFENGTNLDFSLWSFFLCSGVDIPSLLESLHFSEAVINKLRDSTMGHVAIAYMCYKIATPVRYAVTLGGTTLSIKYLSLWGYIRPVPSKEKLKQMYDDQKAKFNKKL